MRIWDINPGYLNHQSLLGEHRELHGIVSILVNKKKGYSRHPETFRWVGYGWALCQRHQLLREEMIVRGFNEKSPVAIDGREGKWPSKYIDPPYVQFTLLHKKYEEKQPGRIPLPKTTQELWAHHKYSVLARDPEKYSEIGKRVSGLRKRNSFDETCSELVELLRRRPLKGRLRNALLHMWGHISKHSDKEKISVSKMKEKELVCEIQRLTIKHQEPYLIRSTALSDLGAWL